MSFLLPRRLPLSLHDQFPTTVYSIYGVAWLSLGDQPGELLLDDDSRIGFQISGGGQSYPCILDGTKLSFESVLEVLVLQERAGPHLRGVERRRGVVEQTHPDPLVPHDGCRLAEVHGEPGEIGDYLLDAVLLGVGGD